MSGKIRIKMNTGIEFALPRNEVQEIEIPFEERSMFIDGNGVTKFLKRVPRI